MTEHIQLKELPYCTPVKKWLTERYGRETAVKIWRRTRRKNSEYLKTWLVRITMNCAVDQLRRSRGLVSAEDVFSESPEPCCESFEGTVIEKTGLKDLMEVLSADEKNVVLLKYYYEYSFSEISAFLQKPLGSVKTTLYRALGKLRKCADEKRI